MNNDQIVVKTFTEVLNEISPADETKKPALLLGNGFSIAFDKGIFSYENLYTQANRLNLFEKLSEAIPELFSATETFDFEHIMQILKHFIIASGAYNLEANLITLAKKDEEGLKNILVEVITRNHPDDPSAISENQYKSCFGFLSHFKSIYSLNYDLLLYWVVLHFLNKLNLTDGFYDAHTGEPNYQPDNYVTWHTTQSSKADIYFLHGALHLYDASYEIRKFCWSRTKIKLKTQILDALGKKMFPLFVSEGSAQSKLEKILHNGYLLKGLRSLANSRGILVAYGLSFKENDQHIIDAIIESTVTHLYVSLFGDPNSESNKKVRENLNKMVEQRNMLVNKKKKRNNLTISFYDAESARIWG